MRRRSLPINLHSDGPVTRPPGALEEPREWLRQHWHELVAELAGMVQVWLEAGRPMAGATAKHSTSPTCARTIDAILRANGLEGFLSNYDLSMQVYDEDFLLMQGICREHGHQEPMTAGKWAELLRAGLLEDRFKDKWGGLRSEHAQTVIVGKLFHAYRGWDFKVGEAVWRLARQEPRGRTHSPLYHFEKVVMAGETGSRGDME